jgi:hypothetical protein
MGIDHATTLAQLNKLPKQPLQKFAFPFARFADHIEVGVKFIEGNSVFAEAKIAAEQVWTLRAKGNPRYFLGQKWNIYIKPYESNAVSFSGLKRCV